MLQELKLILTIELTIFDPRHQHGYTSLTLLFTLVGVVALLTTAMTRDVRSILAIRSGPALLLPAVGQGHFLPSITIINVRE